MLFLFKGEKKVERGAAETCNSKKRTGRNQKSDGKYARTRERGQKKMGDRKERRERKF